jgi:hypothetical protein
VDTSAPVNGGIYQYYFEGVADAFGLNPNASVCTVSQTRFTVPRIGPDVVNAFFIGLSANPPIFSGQGSFPVTVTVQCPPGDPDVEDTGVSVDITFSPLVISPDGNTVTCGAPESDCKWTRQ